MSIPQKHAGRRHALDASAESNQLLAGGYDLEFTTTDQRILCVVESEFVPTQGIGALVCPKMITRARTAERIPFDRLPLPYRLFHVPLSDAESYCLGPRCVDPGMDVDPVFSERECLLQIVSRFSL